MSARQAAPALHVSTVQPETAAKKGGWHDGGAAAAASVSVSVVKSWHYDRHTG